jgi:hypothetical protein
MLVMTLSSKVGHINQVNKKKFKTSGYIKRETTDKPTKEDVEKWSLSDETIDKYKKRYS